VPRALSRAQKDSLMAIIEFPSVETAAEDGLLAVGGDLEVSSLVLAYKNGVFPWPIYSDDLLTWFAPDPRAVLFLEEFRVPRRLTRKRRSVPWEFRINTSFTEVINACASSSTRKSRDAGTWITEPLKNAYIELHRAGYAHSIECFNEGQLVGGLYGVAVGRLFAGESMFFR